MTAAAELGVLRSAARRVKCAAAAGAAQPGRPQTLLVSIRVSARNSSRRKRFCPSDKRDPDQPHGVHDLAAARRCANGSLTSGAFSVAALLDGGWDRELAPRDRNVAGWDRFLIREPFNG